jgi:exoribonuclease II
MEVQIMVNHLENLCEERGIIVEFINNKFIDSDSGTKYNRPVIMVHKVFRECPTRVATAVVEIFTGEGYISECIEIIEKYLTQKFGPVGIKIQPPKVIKTQPPKVIKTMPANKETSIIHNINKGDYKKTKIEMYKGKNDNYYNFEELYLEADISTIDVTNKRGQQNRLNDNEILMPEEQDILELDIVVEPSLHK